MNHLYNICRLEWKILMKQLYIELEILNSQFMIVYFEIYNIKIYSLIAKKKIFLIQKLKFKTEIDYLIEYDFINIFCIWILSKKKIIRFRNVTFNDKLFYNSNESVATDFWENIVKIMKVMNFFQNLSFWMREIFFFAINE